MNITSTMRDSSRVSSACDNEISWKAIFSGLFISLSVVSVLNLLGVGLGLISFYPMEENMTEISIISVLWLMLTGVLSMIAGGWFAGRTTYSYLPSNGILHGLVTWGISTFATFMIVGASAGAMGGIFSPVLAQGFSLASQSSASPISSLQTPSPAANRSLGSMQFNQALSDFLSNGDAEEQTNAQDKLFSFMVLNHGMSEDEAQQMLNSWQNFKNETAQRTEEARKVLGTITIIISLSFILSAIAGAFGGMWGVGIARSKD